MQHLFCEQIFCGGCYYICKCFSMKLFHTTANLGSKFWCGFSLASKNSEENSIALSVMNVLIFFQKPFYKLTSRHGQQHGFWWQKSTHIYFHFPEGFSVVSLNLSSHCIVLWEIFLFGSASSQIYLYLNSPMSSISHCLHFSESDPLGAEAQWKQSDSVTVKDPYLAHKSCSVL